MKAFLRTSAAGLWNLQSASGHTIAQLKINFNFKERRPRRSTYRGGVEVGSYKRGATG